MEQYEIKTNGRMIDLCSGCDKDRLLPGTTNVDNNPGCGDLTDEEIDNIIAVNLMEGFPFDDNTADQITCRYGMRYLWRTAKELAYQLQEAYRVLKPLGRFIVQEYCYLADDEWQERLVPYTIIHNMLVAAMDIMSDRLTLESEATNYIIGNKYVWIFQKTEEAMYAES